MLLGTSARIPIKQEVAERVVGNRRCLLVGFACSRGFVGHLRRLVVVR